MGRRKLPGRYVLLALVLLLFALAPSSTLAQVPCAEQPELAFFDSDSDGMLTVGEIRAAAPDNAQLQTIADQLEEAGVTGVRYSGCGGSGADNASNADNSAGLLDLGDIGDTGTMDSSGADGADGADGVDGADGESADGADGSEGADGAGGSDAADADDGADGSSASGNVEVTELPGVGDGGSDQSSSILIAVSLAAVGVMALSIRWWLSRRTAER